MKTIAHHVHAVRLESGEAVTLLEPVSSGHLGGFCLTLEELRELEISTGENKGAVELADDVLRPDEDLDPDEAAVTDHAHLIMSDERARRHDTDLAESMLAVVARRKVLSREAHRLIAGLVHHEDPSELYAPDEVWAEIREVFMVGDVPPIVDVDDDDPPEDRAYIMESE